MARPLPSRGFFAHGAGEGRGLFAGRRRRRDQILKKIQAKPVLCFLLPVETTCCSLARVAIQDPDDSRFLIAPDPLYQFMSLQI